MASYMPAVAIAIGAVLGLFFTSEMMAGSPLFAQEDLLPNTPAHELLEMAANPECENRIQAIRQLAQRPMSLGSIVPMLSRLTLDSNSHVIAAAENALKEIGEPAAEMLKPLFAENTLSGTLTACSGAHAIGPSCKVYIPELKKLLETKDRVQRRAALYALKGIGEPSGELLDEVIECLSDKDLNVKLMACRVLEQLGPNAAKAETELLTLLDNGGPSTRSWAALCLAAIGPELKNKEVTDLIAKKLAGEGNRPVVPVEYERYLTAIGSFGSEAEKHLGLIRKGLTHRSPLVRSYSALAVYEITGEADEALKTFEKIVQDEVEAPEALVILGRRGEKASPFVTVVERCLDSSEPDTRETALLALMKIGTKNPDTLTRIEELVQDTEPSVQTAARSAIESLKRSKDLEKGNRSGE